MTQTCEIIEKLSELEHEQWAHWRRAVTPPCNPSRWIDVPYKDLPEETKEEDRVWARKAFGIVEPEITALRKELEAKKTELSDLDRGGAVVIQALSEKVANEQKENEELRKEMDTLKRLLCRINHTADDMSTREDEILMEIIDLTDKWEDYARKQEESSAGGNTGDGSKVAVASDKVRLTMATPPKPKPAEPITLEKGEFHKCPNCGVMDYVAVKVRNHPRKGDHFSRCVFCGGLLGAGVSEVKELKEK